MTTTPCELYAIPTTVWLKQAFPSAHPAVSRLSQGQRLAAKRAWNYFEEVEEKDAATRVRLGLSGGTIPSNLWCQFNGDGMRSLYEKGRRYHKQICPEYDWTPQRNRLIPTSPLTSIQPEECPCYGEGCSGETIGIRSVPRSAQIIQEGIPINSQDSRFETITLVSNTPTSTGSPHPPGTPVSVQEPAPILEVSELHLTPIADKIQYA